MIVFRKTAFLALLLLISAWPTPPQHSACGNRLLPVFVTEKDGSIVTTLSSADYRFRSHSGSMSAVGLKHDERRRRIVIMLDASASMRGVVGPPLWPIAIALARHASYAGGENSDLALVLFSDHVIEHTDFPQGNAALQRKLEEIGNNPAFPMPSKAGDSRIYDVLKEQVLKLENPTSADSFLLITDGMDEGSTARANQITDVLSSSMIRVFTILVDPVPGRRSSSGLDDFVRVVKGSGGKVFGPVDSNNPAFQKKTTIAGTQEAMEDRLKNFYRGMFENDVLMVEGPLTGQKSEIVELSLTDLARKLLKKPEIQFPHEVGPCDAVKP